jgi:hypothetical protein
MKIFVLLLCVNIVFIPSFGQDYMYTNNTKSEKKSDIGLFKESEPFIIDSFQFKGNKEVYINKLKTWSKKYTIQFNNRITQESNRLRDNFQFNDNVIDGELRMIVQQSLSSSLVGCSIKILIKDSVIKYRFSDFKELSNSLVGSLTGDPKLFNGIEIGVNYFEKSGTRRFLLKLSDQIDIINKSIKKELLSNDDF